MSLYAYPNGTPKLANKVYYYPNGSKRQVNIIYRKSPNFWIPVFPNPLKIIKNKATVVVYRKNDGSYRLSISTVEHLYSRVTYDWCKTGQDKAGYFFYTWEYENSDYNGLVSVKAKYSDMGMYFINTSNHVVGLKFYKSYTYSGLAIPIGQSTRVVFKYQLIGLPRNLLQPVPDDNINVYYIAHDLNGAEIVYDNWT